MTPGHWLAERSLEQLALRKEGVILLGVSRADGTYVGIPSGATVIESGDTLILYTRAGAIAALDRRRRGSAGDAAHADAVEQRQLETGQ